MKKIKGFFDEFVNKITKKGKMSINNKYLLIGLGVIVLILTIFGVKSFFPKKVINRKEDMFSIVSVDKKSSGKYLELEDTFLVKTKKGSLEEVGKHLYLEPAVRYKIVQKKKNEYEVKVQDVPSDTIVNAKYVDQDVIEDQWAFQSTKDFKVNSIFPIDGSKGINVNTTIEILLSYPDVKDIKDHVEISPAVEGEFVSNGRLWIFKPSAPLQANTIYTVTVKDTLTREGEHLKESYKSTFSTYDVKSTSTAETKYYSSITVDDISTYRPGDPISIRVSNNSNKEKKIARVEILKVQSAGDFKKYLEKSTDVNTTSLGDFSFKEVSENLYTLNDTLPVGYYLSNVYEDNGDLLFTFPIQVHELSAYLIATQSDILAWVAKGNSFLEGVPVKYLDKAAKTDKEGIAKITNYNTLEDKVQYVTIGDGDPVFVGVNNINRTEYPNGYIYTDRPLYQNTDEIQIWGYVPLSHFQEFTVSPKDFVLSVGDETIPVEINKDGTFITKYSLRNYKDGSLRINLQYQNKEIASRVVDVYLYEKEMYNFTVEMDKNYVKAGDKHHFTVTVDHISGVRVPNKEITATVGGKVYTATTDENGVASFDIETEFKSELTTSYHVDYIKITSSLSEYASKGITYDLYVIDRYVYLHDYNYNAKKKKVSGNINYIKELGKGHIDNIDELKGDNYQGVIDVSIEETTGNRELVGQKYNSFTKQNEPNYKWNYSTSTVYNGNVNVENGKFQMDIPYELKKSSDDKTYSYNIIFKMKDLNGNDYQYRGYIYRNNQDTHRNGYASYGSYGMSDYNMYAYYLDYEQKKKSVSDKTYLNLYHYTGVQEVENNPLLIVKYKNKILKQKIYQNKQDLETSFSKDEVPGDDFTAAYFKNGVFYRMPSNYQDYQEEDSKLDVSIKPSKKSYNPGDKVTCEISVSKNGKGIPSKLNISVVDEGVFKTADDNTNILGKIYQNKYYYEYTYSTYRDYSLYSAGGGLGGTSGGVRANFGDTIFFDMVETDKNGNAKVTFTLNDSITSFRITVHAANDDADVGVNYTNIESSLPISVSTVKPRGLKIDDDVVLNATGIGSTKEDIVYDFEIEGIDKKISKTGIIGRTTYVNFGKLPAGNYKATIRAKAGNETDAMEFNFMVGNTQTEIAVKNTGLISKIKKIKPTKNPIYLELYRTSFKEYDEFLEIIKKTNEERMDTKFSYKKAMEFENKYVEEKNNTDIGDVSSFKGETGWKYLNGEEVSYTLTAILAYYDEAYRFDKSIYYNIINNSNKSLDERLDAYMVLAAMKEPILDDLKNINSGMNDKIALAYLFLGDYRVIKNYNFSDPGLAAFAATFLHKDKAADRINYLHETDVANRYLYFAIVSYFENNKVDLESTEDVVVTYGKKKEKLTITSLGKKKLSIYQDDLSSLKIDSKAKDIYVDYYYEGNISEIDDNNKIEDITMSLSSDNVTLGDTVTLKVDFHNHNNRYWLYLPNGLRLSNEKKNNTFVFSNRIDHIMIGKPHDVSEIEIPLYASSPGTYVIEPIIAKKDDHYLMSNSLTITINE